MTAKRVEGEVERIQVVGSRGRESQLPSMAFKRARMERAKEFDLEKELSKVNQEHGGELVLTRSRRLVMSKEDKKQ